MNKISRNPIESLGYDFIPKQYIPKGKDEYWLRDIQHRNGDGFRKLKPSEIKVLEKNANSSDNWSKILVADGFNPHLVKNCSFFGMIRIGRLEPCYLEFKNLRVPTGLYNSTIVSCDIGNNVAIDNVNFMSHYIVGNEVILVNINELATTNHSKFGNGVLKEGEPEAVRIWLEICNENAGRAILPFNGMLAADAWLWSKYRDDDVLLQKFKEFTDHKFDTKRGYYGKIGERTVIKNCLIIKDVWIGSDAYIKGANKLKNLTINSGPEAPSQIGEGVELVNGIVGFGCRIFYGVKAVRFIMASNSQLKYGARLINSYLGDNSTISCCEVLNSLIFPSHEQHHNNSFLCAATVLGQSNMAAGATVGSNHNSRSADGEIVAGRGFWPGLCVSLKHNSKFASFTLIAKSDYPAELNIPIPFSLISNDLSNDQLLIFPGFWFMHNMYALSRNTYKYISRDNRADKSQVIEYDFLAPDSVNEILEALKIFKRAVTKAWASENNTVIPDNRLEKTGAELLETKAEEISKMEILVEGFENSQRKVQILKVVEAYNIFKELVIYYGMSQLIKWIEKKKISSFENLLTSLPSNLEITQWKNTGGQLMPASGVEYLVRAVRTGKINSWDEVHAYYLKKSRNYSADKLQHALAAMFHIMKITPKKFTRKVFQGAVRRAVITREWMTNNIYESRAKDYTNPFRQMVYDTQEEMDKVLGKLDDNSFIKEQRAENLAFAKKAEDILAKFFSR